MKNRKLISFNERPCWDFVAPFTHYYGKNLTTNTSNFRMFDPKFLKLHWIKTPRFQIFFDKMNLYALQIVNLNKKKHFAKYSYFLHFANIYSTFQIVGSHTPELKLFSIVINIITSKIKSALNDSAPIIHEKNFLRLSRA